MPKAPPLQARAVVRPIHTTFDLADASGGPSRSVTRLCDGLARAGAETEILTTAADGPEVLPREAGVDVARTEPPRWRAAFGSASAFGDAVARAAAAPGAVVHDHGLWLPSNASAAHAARRAGAPFVAAPKGMASPWALRHRWWKKRTAWYAYQRRALATAAAFHVTSEAEADDVHRLGLGVPVALVPHGVEAPPEAPPAPPRARRRALFLSRLHPKKGLPLLVEAWARVRPEAWELVIAGPDEGGHRAEVEALVEAACLGEAVSVRGAVADDDKWTLYRSADLFVLPTHSENFGIVVAEALAAGVPVITTHGAPWGTLERERCGWWTEISADALMAALAEATSLAEADLRAAGERGRAYALRTFSWDQAAADLLDVYLWLLGECEAPACVSFPS